MFTLSKHFANNSPGYLRFQHFTAQSVYKKSNSDLETKDKAI